MVILIGAVSCTGKTLMAQKLLETYNIPYLSEDHLKMGLFRANIQCGFTPNDNDETIEKALWGILKGIIYTNIENKQHLIIEGCYIFPNRLKELEKGYSEQVIPVFMGFSKNYIQKNFEAGIIKNRNIIERRLYGEEHTKEQMTETHLQFKKRCEDAAVPYFEIDGDYNEETQIIYDWIDRQITRILDTMELG